MTELKECKSKLSEAVAWRDEAVRLCAKRNCATRDRRIKDAEDALASETNALEAAEQRNAELWQEKKEAVEYAERLLVSTAVQCEPCGSLSGVLSQIDNLICGLGNRNAELVKAIEDALEANQTNPFIQTSFPMVGILLAALAGPKTEESRDE